MRAQRVQSAALSPQPSSAPSPAQPRTRTYRAPAASRATRGVETSRRGLRQCADRAERGPGAAEGCVVSTNESMMSFAVAVGRWCRCRAAHERATQSERHARWRAAGHGSQQPARARVRRAGCRVAAMGVDARALPPHAPSSRGRCALRQLCANLLLREETCMHAAAKPRRRRAAARARGVAAGGWEQNDANR